VEIKDLAQLVFNQKITEMFKLLKKKVLTFYKQIYTQCRYIVLFLKRIKLQRSLVLHDKILTRYIYKELFLYFIVSFLFFFMIFFVNQIILIAQRLLSASAPLWSVVKLLFFYFPGIIAQSAPYATLVGFLMCIGRMMSDNEILIIRASGYGFKLILKPVLILGMIISVISFFTNDYLLPLGSLKANRLMLELASAKPTIEIEANSVKKLGSEAVVIGDVIDNLVSDVVIFEESNDGTQKIISAGSSNLVSSKEEGVVMQFDMNDAIILSVDTQKRNNFDVINADKLLLNIFDSVITGNTNQNPNEMTSYDVKNQIKFLKTTDTPSQLINIWSMEYYKKFALPFASFFFAFFAFSIAIIFGKNNGQTIGLLIGLVVCVLNWSLQISGQLLVYRIGLNGFMTIWFPNFIIGILGVLFYIRLIKK
jgi:lipopolysaccharide export system permease protein